MRSIVWCSVVFSWLVFLQDVGGVLPASSSSFAVSPRPPQEGMSPALVKASHWDPHNSVNICACGVPCRSAQNNARNLQAQNAKHLASTSGQAEIVLF